MRGRLAYLATAAFVALFVYVGHAEGKTDPWVKVKPKAAEPWPDSNPWIGLWTRRDYDLAESIRVAASTFRVSARWLTDCKDDEGGDTARRTLAVTLHTGFGKGWNAGGRGTPAFGPWQFMLDRKPARHGEWGTFGRYVHAAFAKARERRVFVPFRFKTPDSYVGQAITAAFMFSINQSHQWTGAGC